MSFVLFFEVHCTCITESSWVVGGEELKRKTRLETIVITQGKDALALTGW